MLSLLLRQVQHLVLALIATGLAVGWAEDRLMRPLRNAVTPAYRQTSLRHRILSRCSSIAPHFSIQI